MTPEVLAKITSLKERAIACQAKKDALHEKFQELQDRRINLQKAIQSSQNRFNAEQKANLEGALTNAQKQLTCYDMFFVIEYHDLLESIQSCASRPLQRSILLWLASSDLKKQERNLQQLEQGLLQLDGAFSLLESYLKLQTLRTVLNQE